MIPEPVQPPPTGDCKTRSSWRERYGHLPWFRRYEFLGGFLVLLILFAFFLPHFGRPESALAWIEISVFFLLFLFWAGVILGDVEKPSWLKAIVALSLVALLVWLFYRYSGANWGKLGHVFFNWGILSGSGYFGSSINGWAELGLGLWLTVQIAFFTMIFGTLLGLFLAILRSINDPILNAVLIVYVDLFRALPIIVLMIVIYYALPYLGFTFSGMVSGILALTLNSAAYMSEIFRAGIESIHSGQVEAARSLGLTKMQSMRLVILPQAMRVVIPPLTSNYVAMLKDTAICSAIAIMELLKTAITLQSWVANPTPLVAATILYLVILIPMARFSSVLENRMKARGISRAFASKKG
jgi:polar amino acid transport system permease protein